MRHLGDELFVRVIRGVVSGPGSLVSTFPTLLTILVHIPAFFSMIQYRWIPAIVAVLAWVACQ